MFNCKFCNKECKNDNSLRNHERLCKLNPNRQLTNAERGVKVFEFNNYNIKKSVGSEIKTDEQSIQCSNCKLYFSKKQIAGHTGWCYKNKDDKPVLVGFNKTNVGITESELKEYRESHLTCEICGRTIEEATKYKGKFATKKLCVDHDHITNNFRGLLCPSCNRQLGWYEGHKDIIDTYLLRTKKDR